MTFKDLEKAIELMPIPNEPNQQDNYDYMMGAAQDPSNHPINTVPDASIQHDGTQMGTDAPRDASNPPMGTKKESNPVHKHTMPEGTTKTKGKKKK